MLPLVAASLGLGLKAEHDADGREQGELLDRHVHRDKCGGDQADDEPGTEQAEPVRAAGGLGRIYNCHLGVLHFGSAWQCHPILPGCFVGRKRRPRTD